MKRQRGRGRKPGGGGHHQGNRPLESNGPDVKIRGTAAQIYEKYSQYARDAQSSGDRVKYENYLQHAEHYFRIMAATMPRERLLQQQEGAAPLQPPGQAGEERANAEGVEGADPMKVMDIDAAEADAEEGEFETEDEAQDRDRVEAREPTEEREGEDQAGADRQVRRRRRGRRRVNENGQDNAGANGGGSALDSLARRQGALAGG